MSMTPSSSSTAPSLQAAPADRVTVWGPASLSNLGPGFDALGLCLDGLGDRVTAERTEAPGVEVARSRCALANALPRAPEQNTAAVAAQAVLDLLGVPGGLRLVIEKGVRPGSGLGSSAASAAAGAWAANALFGEPLTKVELVEAVLTGEAVASGGRHGDNALPALFGGLVLVSSSEPTRFRCLALTAPLYLAVLFPDVQVLTREARAMLPAQVPLRDAIHNAAELAFLLEAFRAADWETVGRCIMEDRLVEPVRAALVPCYGAVRAAALEAGAFGCALSGSGPALFAVCADAARARHVADAMQAASQATGIDAEAHVTQADPVGTRTVVP